MAGRDNPFREMEQLLNRMSRQLEESMGGPDLGRLTGGGSVPVDVADRGDELVVTADLPGYRPADVEVTLRGDRLQIAAEREEESETSEGTGDDAGEDEAGTGSEAGPDSGVRYVRKERRHESVSRSVTLPEAVDAGATEAEFQNGVLTVTLPKERAGEGDTHTIDVE